MSIFYWNFFHKWRWVTPRKLLLKKFSSNLCIAFWENARASFLEKKSIIQFLACDDVTYIGQPITSWSPVTSSPRLPIGTMTSVTWCHVKEISRDESCLCPNSGKSPERHLWKKNPDLNNTILGTSQSVIPGKKIQNSQFPVIYDSFDFLQFLGISQTVISGKKSKDFFSSIFIYHWYFWMMTSYKCRPTSFW